MSVAAREGNAKIILSNQPPLNGGCYLRRKQGRCNTVQRIKRILQHQFFQACLSFNQERERNRIFCCHDLKHLTDVARICYILVLEEDAGKKIISDHTGREKIKEVVYAAALTHDMGRWVQYDTGEDHALAGAGLAERVLKETGFRSSEIEVITDAVLNHRSGATGGGILGEYLRRADDLSRPCWQCEARDACKKLHRMETAAGLVY
mgnify:CR=1 FL=1